MSDVMQKLPILFYLIFKKVTLNFSCSNSLLAGNWHRSIPIKNFHNNLSKPIKNLRLMCVVGSYFFLTLKNLTVTAA